MIKNKINSYIKLQKISKNPLLEIRVDNEKEAIKIVNHFKTDEIIKENVDIDNIKYILDKYSWKKSAEKFAKILEELL